MAHVMPYATRAWGSNPGATADRGSTFGHKVLQVSAWPCTCRYLYSGLGDHNVFQHGHIPQTVANVDSPSAGTGPPGDIGMRINTLLEGLGGDLLDVLGRSREDRGILPEYVVATEFQNPSQCMGEQSDSESLFGGMDHEAVSFSFNISRDGIFCIKPSSCDTEFGRFVGMTPETQQDWVLPVYAPENSVIIMGGWTHRHCLHYTVSHDTAVAGTAPELQGPLGQRVLTQYLEAGRFCLEGHPRQAWSLKRVALGTPWIWSMPNYSNHVAPNHHLLGWPSCPPAPIINKSNNTSTNDKPRAHHSQTPRSA